MLGAPCHGSLPSCVKKSFDNSSTDMHRGFHSMHQGLQVSTSECNQQKILGLLSVLLSAACPFAHRKPTREHLFCTLITVWCSTGWHLFSVLVVHPVISSWSQDLSQCPSMDLGLGMTHWNSFHYFLASIPSSWRRKSGVFRECSKHNN